MSPGLHALSLQHLPVRTLPERSALRAGVILEDLTEDSEVSSRRGVRDNLQNELNELIKKHELLERQHAEVLLREPWHCVLPFIYVPDGPKLAQFELAFHFENRTTTEDAGGLGDYELTSISLLQGNYGGPCVLCTVGESDANITLDRLYDRSMGAQINLCGVIQHGVDKGQGAILMAAMVEVAASLQMKLTFERGMLHMVVRPNEVGRPTVQYDIVPQQQLFFLSRTPQLQLV